jgi:hypothetical protein
MNKNERTVKGETNNRIKKKLEGNKRKKDYNTMNAMKENKCKESKMHVEHQKLRNYMKKCKTKKKRRKIK